LFPRPCELVPGCRARTVHATSWAPQYEFGVMERGQAGRPACRWVAVALSVPVALRARTCVPSSYGARYELGTQVRARGCGWCQGVAEGGWWCGGPAGGG